MDAWYTPPQTVELCLKALLDTFSKLDYATLNFVEPAAGNGAFLEGLCAIGIKKEHIFAYDLDPTTSFKDITYKHVDFLTIDSSDFGDGAVFIGNPPFSNGRKRGRGSGPLMHRKFMQHAVKLKCSMVAFILPNSFNRPTKKYGAPPELVLCSVTPLPLKWTKGRVQTSFFIYNIKEERKGEDKEKGEEKEKEKEKEPFKIVPPDAHHPDIMLIKRWSHANKLGNIVENEKEVSDIIDHVSGKWKAANPGRAMGQVGSTWFHVLPDEGKRSYVLDVFSVAFNSGAWRRFGDYSTSKTNATANIKDCVFIFNETVKKMFNY